MERTIQTFIVSAWLAACTPVLAGQVPGAASDSDIPISHRDRVYSAEQFSNTVSVTDPFDQTARRYPARRSAARQSQSLYRGQLLVHGLGFSPDHRPSQ
jgi:hypothetical protein